MRKNIIQHLIGPAERFLTEGLKVKSQDVDELKMMIGSLEFGLEMLKEMNWNDEWNNNKKEHDVKWDRRIDVDRFEFFEMSSEWLEIWEFVIT